MQLMAGEYGILNLDHWLLYYVNMVRVIHSTSAYCMGRI